MNTNHSIAPRHTSRPYDRQATPIFMLLDKTKGASLNVHSELTFLQSPFQGTCIGIARSKDQSDESDSVKFAIEPKKLSPSFFKRLNYAL